MSEASRPADGAAIPAAQPPALLSVQRRGGEVVVAAALACAGAAMLRGALDLEFGTLALPAAGFVPALAGAGLLVSSLVSLATAWRSVGPAAEAPVRLVDRTTGCVLLLLFALAAAFEALGAPITLGLFILAMLRLLSPLRLHVAAALAAAIAGTLWLFFARLLEAPLPTGPF
ncbi:tripartite tricarboxylate transporter TctB family protein [Roseomonas xinghualingensis]|uniref:tripartite tricarboxylate transporter TctB family protein n=1 Tax=Roseomonas xinghualingensis TaxID=2986475 RepID=UPI0021F17AC3|nr:tripartite tricarboxylate transporter TctB family protein [Roseomonas sp. SXEYE001]MCV4210224.1 tripartite tricarboxylate transporter TctB family protein [Roseomonas sp. SXEYE001]